MAPGLALLSVPSPVDVLVLYATMDVFHVVPLEKSGPVSPSAAARSPGYGVVGARPIRLGSIRRMALATDRD
jgi:hypothetical protein